MGGPLGQLCAIGGDSSYSTCSRYLVRDVQLAIIPPVVASALMTTGGARRSFAMLSATLFNVGFSALWLQLAAAGEVAGVLDQHNIYRCIGIVDMCQVAQRVSLVGKWTCSKTVVVVAARAGTDVPATGIYIMPGTLPIRVFRSSSLVWKRGDRQQVPDKTTMIVIVTVTRDRLLGSCSCYQPSPPCRRSPQVCRGVGMLESTSPLVVVSRDRCEQESHEENRVRPAYPDGYSPL